MLHLLWRDSFLLRIIFYNKIYIYYFIFLAVFGGFTDKACNWCGIWNRRVSLHNCHGKYIALLFLTMILEIKIWFYYIVLYVLKTKKDGENKWQVLTLKAVGILLPMFVIIRTITAIQRSLRYQFLVSSQTQGLLCLAIIFVIKMF